MKELNLYQLEQVNGGALTENRKRYIQVLIRKPEWQEKTM